MSVARRIQQFNRERKWRLFNQHFAINEKLKILDVGIADREFSDVDNYLEKHYPFPHMITALSIGEPERFREHYPTVTALAYDGKRIPFLDRSFDIGWSNAVIEHVGSPADQLAFLKELMRASKTVWFTTPNRYFPIEIHTRTPLLHFLPKAVFDFYLKLVGKKWATGSYMHLLSLADIRELLKLANAKESTIHRNKLFGFTLDFVVIIKGDSPL